MSEPTRRTLLRLLPLAAVSLAALAAGCTSGPEVRRDRDPSADLGAYRTFSFYDPVAADRSRYTTLVSARLKQATRAQLERHGYVHVDHDADLRVNLMLAVVDRPELRGAPLYGWHGRAWAGSLDTVTVREGTLAIDLVDARRRALVWQGVAEGRLDAKAIENPGPLVDSVVGEIFAVFPGAPARR